ncbi:hypothetical protein HMPREF1092_01240 [Clostridium thermobutyricum]|uniref:Uncharacterized protein n=1 Tax=Clostridium thermobutyricum TaxID=29372 RepID=N9WGJ7_9CLOT|nr:hypothetical protein [Clostridium thermobutyricum]ENZ02005.1 hypothetical protein HMPREF1092_01240 [Clostridium thermobutyricum]
MLTVNHELLNAICCYTSLSKVKVYEKLDLNKYFNFSYFCRITGIEGYPTPENIEVIQKALDESFTITELSGIATIQNTLMKRKRS